MQTLCTLFLGSVFVFWPSFSRAAASLDACPCADDSLCRPSYRPQGDFARDREVFGFVTQGGADFMHYDWSIVSTIAWPSNTDLMCEAHKHGARVVMGAEAFTLPINASERAKFVTAQVKAAKAGHYDGVTFDYESPIGVDEVSKMDTYIALVTETTAAFHDEIPGSQVSVCVAWSPDDIDDRAYDYPSLSQASDLFYIMAYDTRSQIYDRCMASANSPVGITTRAIQRFTDIGIPPAKLVLGLPWYGYDYPCTNDMESPQSKYCPIKEVPFRGVNCSDAAGKERNFDDITEQLERNQTITGRMWDPILQNAYFNYKAADGAIHQVWYDDAESLHTKYSMARAAGLRGVGPYTYDSISYDTLAQQEQSKTMWEALHAFTG